MNRVSLVRFFSEYQPTDPEEGKYIPRFLELLAGEDCYERTHLPGHITGSAWILNPARSHALLVLHAKLNRWMQPGGHADGNEDILQVALMEAQEETGLQTFKVIHPYPFDVDIHTIPARKEFPAHEHYDVRFLLEANPKDPILVSEESHDVQWVPLNRLTEFTAERSILRMRQKVTAS